MQHSDICAIYLFFFACILFNLVLWQQTAIYTLARNEFQFLRGTISPLL